MNAITCICTIAGAVTIGVFITGIIAWSIWKISNWAFDAVAKAKMKREYKTLTKDFCVVWDDGDSTPGLGIDAAGDCVYMLDEYVSKDWWCCSRVPFAHKVPLKEFNLQIFKDSKK